MLIVAAEALEANVASATASANILVFMGMPSQAKPTHCRCTYAQYIMAGSEDCLFYISRCPLPAPPGHWQCQGLIKRGKM